jgi:hypothetical protein
MVHDSSAVTIGHIKTSPGKCNLLTYKSHVEADKLIIGYPRYIPFVMCPVVRKQINQMLMDDIL